MPLVLQAAIKRINLKLKIFQSIEQSFDDQEVKEFIDGAVRQYSLIKGKLVFADLNLVSGQQAYDWPEDALKVEPFAFKADTLLTQNTLTDYISPASFSRHDILNSNQVAYSSGTVSVDEEQQKIIISPTPSSSETVKLPYIQRHALNDEGTEYPTILDKDVDKIIDKVLADMLTSIADALMVSAGKAGDRDYKGETKAEFFEKRAKELNQRFEKGFPKAVVGRT